MIRLSPILFLISAAISAGPAEDLDACLTPENLDRLERGELVVYKKGGKDADGASRAFGRVIAIINRSKGDIWQLLIHDEEHMKYQPRLVSVERYETDEGDAGIKETVRVAFKSFTYHFIETHDEAGGVLTWRLDKSKENSIRDTEGSWVVRPHGEERCIVMYTISVDSGTAFPNFIENILFNRDLPDIVKSMKEYLEARKDEAARK